MQELEDVSKQIQSLNNLLKENKHFQVEQDEKYENTVLNGHTLTITTYLKDTRTGEKAELTKYSHKLSKEIPTYLTKHNLWHHTQGELLQLKQLLKERKERKPSKKTLKDWKQAIKLDNVLQSNHNSK